MTKLADVASTLLNLLCEKRFSNATGQKTYLMFFLGSYLIGPYSRKVTPLLVTSVNYTP